jgi:hypothetical protein
MKMQKKGFEKTITELTSKINEMEILMKDKDKEIKV